MLYSCVTYLFEMPVLKRCLHEAQLGSLLPIYSRYHLKELLLDCLFIVPGSWRTVPVWPSSWWARSQATSTSSSTAHSCAPRYKLYFLIGAPLMSRAVDPDPDPAFQVNPDPDTDPGFWWLKFENKIQLKFVEYLFLNQKLLFTYP